MINRILIFLGLGFLINYIRWRIMFSIDHFSYIGLIFAISEIIVIWLGVLNTYFIAWNYKNSLVLSSKDETFEPVVDIFLLCCNEPFEVLEQSIKNILRIDYPSDKMRIFVSDDGNSNELRGYIADLKEDNLLLDITYKNRVSIFGHSKAGNINDTLAFSRESASLDSLILILDSDMQCKPNILKVLVPYLSESPKTAFVQSPQSFMNVDFWDTLGQHYRYFYQVIMKSWSRWNCTPCCGTNVLFQRKALQDINGFQYGCVTEDFLTSMILHSKGYTSKYCAEELAIGLAPFTLNDFYQQRFRWALGGAQLLGNLKKVYNKLTFAQLWVYMNAGIFIYTTPFLIFLISSVLLTFYSNANFTLGNTEYLIHFGCFVAVHIINLLLLFYNVGYLYMLRSFQESVYMLNCYTLVLIYSIFNIPYSFKITPKIKKYTTIENFKWCLPYLVYLALTIYGIYRNSEALHQKISNIVWSLIICCQMIPPIRYAIFR